MNTAGQIKINLFALVLCLLSSGLSADTLEMKSGKILEGKYVGGSQATLRFQMGSDLKVIPVSDILAITFSPVKETAKTSAAPKKAAPPAPASGGKSLASGTILLVKLKEDVNTMNKKVGDTFVATLETHLSTDGAIVLPAGTKVYGKVLGSKKGGIGARKALLEITLTGVLVEGALKPVKTSILTGEGPKGGLGRKVVKGAALGALADGNRGAEDGAKIGAGIGILAGGKHAGLSSGALVEFVLTDTFIK